MPITRRHQTLLLLDASALESQTGLLQGGQWLSFQRIPGDTLETLFEGVSSCLQEACMELEQVDGFLYCEGPGSVLGIRLAAMALQGWKSLPTHKSTPILTYRSLPAIASLIQMQENLELPFHCIAESGRDLWNLLSLTADNWPGKLETVTSEKIEDLREPVFHIPMGRQKKTPPGNVKSYPYNIEEIPRLMDREEILQLTDTPKVYRTHPNKYVKWSAKRHR